MISKRQWSISVKRIWMINQKSKVPTNINSRGILQDERVGLILIMIGQKKIFFTHETDFYKQLYNINTEVQQMETYQIFVFPIGNTKITEELQLQSNDDSVTPNIEKKIKEFFG